MSTTKTYHWPTKLKKFGIDDPFQKILATKYEKEIPWQTIVRDAADLKDFTETVLLPTFIKRATYPYPNRVKNHFFITHTDMSLEATLNSEANRNDSDIETIAIIQMLEGDEVATDALVKLVNKRKFTAFKAWIDLLEKLYPNQPEFRLLLLRPLFELSGRSCRRKVVDPSPDVIEWLHYRITQGLLSPDENIANQYCLKLGMGSQKLPDNGWQFIPVGINNAPQLCAASRGSGWCVAGMDFASHYLNEYDFYILRSKQKPVVALRVLANRDWIKECQGQGNTPPVNWYDDIEVFIRTQIPKLRMADPQPTAHDTFVDKPYAWWRERCKIWPFALALAPDGMKDDLLDEFRNDAYLYANLTNFGVLAGSIGIELDTTFWRMLLESIPMRYANCPSTLQTLPGIQEACIKGWMAWINEGHIIAKDLKSIPEFVRVDARFQQALTSNVPTKLRDMIRKSPKTYDERVNPFKLQEFLPASKEYSVELVRTHIVNVLVNNNDGVFCDEKFPAIIRERGDFLAIREQAWLEVTQIQPPLWFALPDELQGKPEFQPVETVPKRVDLDNWCVRVGEKPWLLNQKNGVPKSIRHHRRILEAYREGWLPLIRKTPWRLWVVTNSPSYWSDIPTRRAYLSYGLLYDERIINTMSEGWRDTKGKIAHCWFSEASERMRNIPAVQVAILQAISPNHNMSSHGEQSLRVCVDIKARLKKAERQQDVATLLHKRLRTLLTLRGII